MQIRKILVLVEPDTEVQPAVNKAAQLAAASGAELELLLAEYNSYLEDGFYFDPVQAKKLRYEYGEQRLLDLNALAEPLRENNIAVSVVAAWGKPVHGEVLRRIRETSPDLMVKAAHHHGKASRLLGHTDWELVRHCPIPLLLVKGEEWDKEQGESPTVLAAVDPNHINDKPAELDDLIIRSAQQLVAAFEGGNGERAESVNAVQLFHSAWIPPLSGLYPLQADIQHEEEQLIELGKKHGISPEQCIWSQDRIVDVLPKLISDAHIDIVAMGAVSRSRLEEALIGNTAEKLLDELNSDVLVLKLH